MNTLQNKSTTTNHADEILQSAFPELYFPCYVKGQKLTATYLGRTEDSIVDFQFKFSFSDGYSTIFYCTEYGKWYDDNNIEKKSIYLKAVKDELLALLSCIYIEKTLVFLVHYNKTNFNVFVFKDCMNDDRFSYSVYYKGEYRFHMKKMKDEWLAKSFCVIDTGKLDDKLISIISKELESHQF